MTTNRIYKARKSVDEAIQEIVNLSEQQFHPEVVIKAAVALKDVEIDDGISQLPSTKLEEERFAYFYKDTLSNAYNQNYLGVVLMKNSFDLEFKWMEIFSIKNFSLYNKEYGWKAGDNFLKSFSDILCKNNPNDLVFRVFGDDFVVLSKEELSFVDVKDDFDKLIGDLNIEYSVQNIDLTKTEISNVTEVEIAQVE